jgi:hypothetical protein
MPTRRPNLACFSNDLRVERDGGRSTDSCHVSDGAFVADDVVGAHVLQVSIEDSVKTSCLVQIAVCWVLDTLGSISEEVV